MRFPQFQGDGGGLMLAMQRLRCIDMLFVGAQRKGQQASCYPLMG
jgi:hypothetical protein